MRGQSHANVKVLLGSLGPEFGEEPMPSKRRLRCSVTCHNLRCNTQMKKLLAKKLLSMFIQADKKAMMKHVTTVQDIVKLLPLGPTHVELLTYVKVVEFFATKRPADPAGLRGALLLEEHERGKQCTYLFLTPADEPLLGAKGAPRGRRFTCSQIDQELLEALGGYRVLLVE
jgi:hypothetical protein